MRKAKLLKIISLVTTLALTLSLTGGLGSVHAAKKLKSFKTENGSVLIEAEDTTLDSALVATVKSSEASGKQGVRMNVDDRETPAADTPGGIGFEFAADTAGTYIIWARYSCINGGNDSCWRSVSDGEYEQWFLQDGSVDENDFKWSKITSVDLDKGGKASMRIIPRETGAIIDRFLITTSSFYSPNGLGDIPNDKLSVETFPSGKYTMPSITPPPEHPRLMFRLQDIDTIKENMKAAEQAVAVSEFNTLKETEFDGILPQKDTANYNGKMLGVIEAKAFDYIMYGNEQHAKEAIEAIKNYARTCTYVGIHDYTREMGHVLFTSAEVYDWCYPLLTEDDKLEIVALCQGIGRQMEIGFPPSGQGAVCGHGSEMQLMRDWLALAIATYDEYPDIYNYVGGRYLSEYVPARNYWYPAKSQHQGSAYGNNRFECDLWGQWLIYRMSGDTVYVPEAGDVAYQWIYTRRPDGQVLREGDDYNEGREKNTYWNILHNTLFEASNFYKDPILKKEYMKEAGPSSFIYTSWSRTPVQYMIFNDPTVGSEDVSTLPLTRYQPSPQGAMVARTGWNMGMDSPDVLAYMKIGEVWGSNHNHRDAGNFQIYYKGILASESGYYESYGTPHDGTYNKATVAHNTLLISSDSDKNGNQRMPSGGAEPATLELWMKDGNYETGEVIGYEFGPDTQKPEYSYIAGDIAKAYNSGVKEAVRSMLFMPLDDEEHPAAFVVMDKVTTAKSDAKKAFMLHSQQEPEVNGNVTVIKRDKDGYNGMLTNQTLLPASAKIEKIGGGGKESWLGDTNYALKSAVNPELAIELGWGRVEISPEESSQTDYFLNVMYVNDADKDLALEKAQLIENEFVAGAKIFNRAAVFSKTKERISDNLSFEVQGDETELKVNVAGLKEGTWTVKVNGKEAAQEVASKDGGIIYFTAPAGKYELSYSSADANKTFDTSKPEVSEGIMLKLNKNYIYSDVAPTIIDGRTLVPLRVIFENLDAAVEWDDATQTVTGTKGRKTVKLTINDKIAFVDGEEKELDVPAMLINDRTMVPVRFIAESLGATVGWDDYAKTVNITARAAAKKWDIPNQVEVINLTQSGSDDEGNDIENSVDGQISTRWAPYGKDGDAWGIYEFDGVYSLDKVYLSYHNGNARVYDFSIAVSEDGENYKTVLENKQSSGTTLELESYDLGGAKARYVKYIGGGNSVNLWNSVTEIVFTKK